MSHIFDWLADAGKARPEHRRHQAVVKADNGEVTADREAAVLDGPRCADGHGVAHAHQCGGRVGGGHQLFRQGVTGNHAIFGSRHQGPWRGG